VNNWDAGAWSGKCFKRDAGGEVAVSNLLSPVPPFGGTVLSSFDWSRGSPLAFEYYSGDLFVEGSE
jgi:hypothetical protein